jgi:hypothetical protein
MDCFTQEFLAVIAGFIVFVFLTWTLVTDLDSLDEIGNGQKDERAASEHDHHTGVAFPPNVKTDIPPAPGNQRDPYQERQYRLEKKRYRIEIVTLVILSIYAAFTYFLLVATQSASQISAEALTDVQRAFVFPTNGYGRPRLGIGPDGNISEITFEMNWRNSGTTPARRSILNINAKIMEKLPDSFTFPDGGIPEIPFTIPPQTIQQGGALILSAGMFKQIVADKTQPLFYWGWIKYRDFFPNSKPHLTEFCNFTNNPAGDISDPKKAIIDVKFSACGTHNCSDDDCPDYKAKMADYK